MRIMIITFLLSFLQVEASDGYSIKKFWSNLLSGRAQRTTTDYEPVFQEANQWKLGKGSTRIYSVKENEMVDLKSFFNLWVYGYNNVTPYKENNSQNSKLLQPAEFLEKEEVKTAIANNIRAIVEDLEIPVKDLEMSKEKIIDIEATNEKYKKASFDSTHRVFSLHRQVVGGLFRFQNSIYLNAGITESVLEFETYIIKDGKSYKQDRFYPSYLAGKEINLYGVGECHLNNSSIVTKYLRPNTTFNVDKRFNFERIFTAGVVGLTLALARYVYSKKTVIND